MFHDSSERFWRPFLLNTVGVFESMYQQMKRSRASLALSLLIPACAWGQTTINVDNLAQVSATGCTLSSAIVSANTAAPVAEEAAAA